MRIGFFTDGFLPQLNGVATSVAETAKELERRGHEVYIIAPKYPGHKGDGPKVIRLASFSIHAPTKTRFALSLPDQAMRKILSLDFDIIHGHSGGSVTLLGWEISRAKKIPFVATYHTLWNRYTHYFLKGKVVTPKMMERATKIFGNRVDYLIAPTTRVEKELKSYGVRRPIRVVPSGIDIEKFKNAKPGFLRTKLNLSKDEKILLYVGRLGKEKSVDFLIRSFKLILGSYPKAHLVIVGDGVERKRLEALAKRMGVQKNTHFLGDVKSQNIQDVYRDASVFVFASSTETQGLVLPEALASGVPSVVVDDPAFECIEDGKNGFRVHKNENEFAKKTLSIIEDSKLASQMSEYACTSAQELSVARTVDSLEEIYFSLFEKNNRESVGRIMETNARNEAIFGVSAVFWASVVLVRLFTLLSHTDAYPKFIFFGQSFYQSAAGLVLLLLFVALFIRKRAIGFLSMLVLGVGLGFLANDALSALFTHEAYFNYWNTINLIPVLLVGIIPVLIFHDKQGESHVKFYIGTRELKHKNPENPKVTVVVPAYNESEFIIPTLKSLINQTYNEFELIVVDNNSDDDTAEVAKRYGARVILEKKKGVAAARQAGFMAARGEIILSTDADSVIPENWIERIVLRYDKNKKLVGFGGLSLLYSGAVTARAAGRYLFPLFWRIDKILSGGWNMAGFNMSVRKKAFEEIGGFDISLKMGEDIDLSQKLRTVGDVEIDTNLVAYASGRRFANGLTSGLMIYGPWWVSKVILRREKPFEFPAVRSEKATGVNPGLLPASLFVLILSLLYYLANAF